jgi:hypothetical protein
MTLPRAVRWCLAISAALSLGGRCDDDDDAPEPTRPPSTKVVFEVDIVYPGASDERARVAFAAAEQCPREQSWDAQTVRRRPLRRTIRVTCGNGEVRYGAVVYRYPDRAAAEAAT